MTFISPLYITIERKTKKNRVFALNLNQYRNAHFRTLHQVKKLYSALMCEKYGHLDPLSTPINLKYKLFLRRKGDYGNFKAIVEKFFLDWLIEAGAIEDDNCNIVTSDLTTFCGIDKDNPRCEIEIIKKVII